MGKDGSVSVKEGDVMSEDAPVNTGAVAWPDDFTASVMVRRMQAKLHRWATEDPGRRFGDLFNLAAPRKRLVISPVKPGGTQREVSGPDG
jgi:RNA-directed DNA polymerase